MVSQKRRKQGPAAHLLPFHLWLPGTWHQLGSQRAISPACCDTLPHELWNQALPGFLSSTGAEVGLVNEGPWTPGFWAGWAESHEKCPEGRTVPD